jgi:ribosome maturation factor RimP
MTYLDVQEEVEMGAEAAVLEALQPVVRASGLEIWDVERSGNSLRVLVDRPGGVDLDSLASLSGAISEVLDLREDLVPPGRYELDVSSPGVERRLRYPEHFSRCIGQEVAVKTVAGFDGPRRFEGTLTAVSGTEVALAVMGTDEGLGHGEVRVPIEAIERAHTIFRWGPTPHVAKRAGHKKGNKGGTRSGIAAAKPGPASAGPAEASEEAE